MTLDDEDKRWIVATLSALIAPKADPVAIGRLTVEQFAVAVEHHVDVIHRKIRTGEIPPRLVFGQRPKRLSARALDQFGVTAFEAHARLKARNLLPEPLPSSG